MQRQRMLRGLGLQGLTDLGAARRGSGRSDISIARRGHSPGARHRRRCHSRVGSHPSRNCHSSLRTFTSESCKIYRVMKQAASAGEGCFDLMPVCELLPPPRGSLYLKACIHMHIQLAMLLSVPPVLWVGSHDVPAVQIRLILDPPRTWKSTPFPAVIPVHRSRKMWQ